MQHFILFAAWRHCASRTLQLRTTIQKAPPQAGSDSQALSGSLSGEDQIHALYACCKAIMAKFKHVRDRIPEVGSLALLCLVFLDSFACPKLSGERRVCMVYIVHERFVLQVAKCTLLSMDNLRGSKGQV